MFPHSWDLSCWPAEVWPGESKRGRWIVRSYRDELMRHGALSRAGRTLVVLGTGYARWLEQRAANVPGFQANNPSFRVHSSAAHSNID